MLSDEKNKYLSVLPLALYAKNTTPKMPWFIFVSRKREKKKVAIFTRNRSGSIFFQCAFGSVLKLVTHIFVLLFGHICDRNYQKHTSYLYGVIVTINPHLNHRRREKWTNRQKKKKNRAKLTRRENPVHFFFLSLWVLFGNTRTLHEWTWLTAREVC